ncbi:catalase, partial [Staphylococcus epidermidis]|uniref:catalase n=1 Tax=Staphylococcus epidermidis TaxID=1282 RepID=UPI00119D2BB7
VKPEPPTNIRNAQNNSDFWTRLPQAFHQVTILMSDTAIPKPFRNIHPFPSHTYSIYNHKPQRLSLKYHFPTQ